MSISLDMYKLLKKSSLRPIIFLDMDETFIVRYRDFSNLERSVETMKKRILKHIDNEDYDSSSKEEYVSNFENSQDRILGAEGLKFMVRGGFCELISELNNIGDIYVLTASKDSSANEYLNSLKASDKYRCAGMIKGLISSIRKFSFSDSDIAILPENPTMRPYVLIDDNHFGVSSSKHALMNRTGFKELEPFHVQVPRFHKSLDFDVQKIVLEVKRKIENQTTF